MESDRRYVGAVAQFGELTVEIAWFDGGSDQSCEDVAGVVPVRPGSCAFVVLAVAILT